MNSLEVAIMGATGTGKTTFINLLSGAQLPVGRGLESCTYAVQTAAPFLLDSRSITLIDTPGFDDTSRSDTDILRMIATFFADTYEKGRKLAGIIYMHRISDFKMGGTSARNFKMFRKLCGDETLKNVIIVTNMWGEVAPDIGNMREQELMNSGLFFKPVLDNGAQLCRHNNTVDSGRAILRRILNNRPLPLCIQKEVVDQKKDISQTMASDALTQELKAQAAQAERERQALEQEKQRVLRQKEEAARIAREQERQRIEAERRRIAEEERIRVERLAAQQRAEQERIQREIAAAVEAARLEAERIRAEHERRAAALQAEIAAAQHAHHHSGGGGCCIQ